MPDYADKGRSGASRIQAQVRRKAGHSYALAACTLACVALAGCSDPLQKPVDLFHDLEGGQIAAERPPPPGAGQPYPHVGTVPPKPDMPSQGFRTALESQLAAERDEKELLAADLPMEKVPPPPDATAKPAPAAPAPASPAAAPPASAPTGNPAGAQPPEAGAPAAAADANATIAAADAPPPAAKPAQSPPPAPPQDAQLQIVGEPVQFANLPLVPDAPPAPASFEGVPPLPAPTPRALPHPLELPPGKPVFFANGADVVTPSQKQTLADIRSSRGKRTVEIIGLGDAESDTPLGQEAAIDLALRRARAVAKAFAAMQVPQSAMRLAARPYGRGALVVLLP